MRTKLLVTALAAAAAAAGCGGSSTSKVDASKRDFTVGCVGEAEQRNVPKADAEKRCGCLADHIYAGLSQDEAVELDGHDPSLELRRKVARLSLAASTACR